MCGKVEVEDSREKDKTDIDEESSMIDVCVCFRLRFGCDSSWLSQICRAY